MTTRIEQAIEVFVRGFSFTRSFTHPYVAQKLGSVWRLADGLRKRGDYRSEEWIAHGMAPVKVDRMAREQARGRFGICAICGVQEPQEPLRAEYKRLGYRLQTTEPFMVHDLRQIPSFDAPAEIVRVTTKEMAERLGKATRARPLSLELLADGGGLRQYVAVKDGAIVGWVRSIVLHPPTRATWCSSMHVLPGFRRRGIARSLLCRMLRDDRDGGAKSAVLLASHTGAKLYPVVGYEQIGTLLLFKPKRK